MSATNLLTGTNCLRVAMVALAAGCSSPIPAKKSEPVFYPEPPAMPRVQYLTSISSESDLGRTHGKWLQFVVGEGPPADPLVKPYGVTVHENKIFVCDTVDRSIAIFNLAGKRMTRWIPRGEAKFQLPVGLDFDADGRAFVADANRGAVLIFDHSRKFTNTLSEEGMKPAAVAVAQERVYVADVSHHNVAVFDRASLHKLFTVPRDNDNPEARLFTPTNLALDSSNHLFVSDTGAFHIQEYDHDGRWLRNMGMEGDSPGQFARPKGVAVDRAGRIYVVDAAAQVVQVFSPDGQLLMYFGGPDGGGHELSLPAGIAIDYDNVERFRPLIAPNFSVEYLVLVSSQYGDNKINIYGFGHQQ